MAVSKKITANRKAASKPASETRKPKPLLDLYIVRHGESQSNVNKKVHLETPNELIPLTRKGWKQANNCGRFLAKHFNKTKKGKKVVLFISSFKRTRQTAQAIFNQLSKAGYDVDVRESDMIVEQHFGVATGTTKEELAMRHPDYSYLMDMDKRHGTRHFTLKPGGETRAQVELRSRVFLGTMRRYRDEHNFDGPVVTVVHGITGPQIAKGLLNKRYEETDRERDPDNCDVRMIARLKPTSRITDYGYIWKSGKAHTPRAHRRVTTTELFRANTYAPKPAR